MDSGHLGLISGVLSMGLGHFGPISGVPGMSFGHFKLVYGHFWPILGVLGMSNCKNGIIKGDTAIFVKPCLSSVTVIQHN